MFQGITELSALDSDRDKPRRSRAGANGSRKSCVALVARTGRN